MDLLTDCDNLMDSTDIVGLIEGNLRFPEIFEEGKTLLRYVPEFSCPWVIYRYTCNNTWIVESWKEMHRAEDGRWYPNE